MGSCKTVIGAVSNGHILIVHIFVWTLLLGYKFIEICVNNRRDIILE